MTNALPSHVTERTVDLLGGKVATRVLSAGSGDPLVFLHGAGQLMWTPLLESLAKSHTVYAPEHPGANPDELTHLRDIWDLVLYYDELLDVLDLPTTALVGHSFGGMVAAELAANSRHRIDRLVLLAPVGFWRDDVPIPDIAVIPQERLLELMLHDPSGPLATALAPPKDDPQALLEAALRMASVMHFIWPLPDKGLKRRIHRITAPTLLIWGAQDKVVPPIYAEEFTSRLRDSRLELIDNASHLPHLEQPAATSEHVLKFLS
jgi:pimeloyl-ACP methyl ester carboxylesterase